MHGHNHVEEVGLDVDPFRLREPHDQAEQRHDQQNEPANGDIGEDGGAGAGRAPTSDSLDRHGVSPCPTNQWAATLISAGIW
jgi:hypothetical protein